MVINGPMSTVYEGRYAVGYIRLLPEPGALQHFIYVFNEGI